jgi:enamine deaminase RidA (YjgF/YER057c/UK114 family)
MTATPERVQVKLDPDPFEPFRLSQAIRVGAFLFVSGQAAIAEDGTVVGTGDFDAQAQTFTDVRRVLESHRRADSIREVSALALPELEIENEAVAVARP